MSNFNLDDYEPVAKRIQRFYNDNPEGRILTRVLFDDGKRIMCQARVYKTSEATIWASGLAEEVRGEGFVNKTSATENSETSAIGRALANANYGGDLRTSREEMEHVVREEERQEQSRMKVDSLDKTMKDLKQLLIDKGLVDEDERKFVIKAIAGDRPLNTSGVEYVRKQVMISSPDTLAEILVGENHE